MDYHLYIIYLSLIMVSILFVIDLNKIKRLKKLVIYKKENPIKPFVSILIPARNEENIIIKCIKNICKSTYTNYEIIIISDGSTDNTYEVVEELSKVNQRIRPFRQESKGKNAALNKGLKLSKGEIIIFVDADTFVERDWLEHIIEPIINGRASATSGNPYPYIRNWVTYYHCLFSQFRIIRGGKSLFGGATIALKKELIDKIGGIDEIAYGVDDIVLSNHVKELKYAIERVENAKVKTDLSSTFSDFLKIETRFARSLFKYKINKKPILEQILDPINFIKNYYTFINSMFFITGIFLFLLPNINIIIGLKILYLFNYTLALLRHFSIPFILFLTNRNTYWLKYFYVSTFLLLMSYLYFAYAMFTYNKSSNFFLGPRKLH